MRTPSPLDSLRIVMVNTSHPGNIGSAARAMRVMGLYNLYLVNPKKHPSNEATSLASAALDVLNNAIVVPTLNEAIADCEYVYGTSARARHIGKPEINVENAAIQAFAKLQELPDAKIALVFGTERTGLTNEEVDRCHELIYIPTENNYNSLNIASAIQIISYEFRKHATLESNSPLVLKDDKQKPAPQESLEGFFTHLEQTLIEIDFLNPDYPKHLMRKLRLLYKKAELTSEEINILRGILTATQKRSSCLKP